MSSAEDHQDGSIEHTGGRSKKPKPLQCLTLRKAGKFESLPTLTVAKELARCMHESKFYLLRNCIETVGLEKTVELFHETAQVQEAGGIVSNTGGMKSPGGVFFALLKKCTPKEQLRAIFRLENEAKRIKKRENVLKFYGNQSLKRGNVFSRLGPTPFPLKQRLLAKDTDQHDSGDNVDVAVVKGLDHESGLTARLPVITGRGEGDGRSAGEEGEEGEEEEGEVLMEVDDNMGVATTAIEQTLAHSIPTFLQLNNVAGVKMEEEKAVQEFESSSMNFPTFVQLD